MMKNISNKRKLLIILALSVTTTIIINNLIYYFKNSNDFNNFLTWGFAIAGLVFAAWQIIIALNASEESKISNFQTAIAELRKDSDARDYNQEQALAEIKQDLAVLKNSQELHHQEAESRLNLHRSEIGHKGLMEQMFVIKNEISDLRAALSVSSKQGEIYLKIERLAGRVESLSSQIGNILSVDRIQDRVKEMATKNIEL